MENTVFKIEQRVDRPMMRVIHAVAENPRRKLTIYLNNKTKEPMYPITIEQIVLGITITLDSDNKATCSLPPVISENMIDSFIEYLTNFRNMVLAARRLIKEEQQIFKNTE